MRGSDPDDAAGDRGEDPADPVASRVEEEPEAEGEDEAGAAQLVERREPHDRPEHERGPDGSGRPSRRVEEHAEKQQLLEHAERDRPPVEPAPEHDRRVEDDEQEDEGERPPPERLPREQREGEQAERDRADREEAPALDREGVAGREPEGSVEEALRRRLVVHDHDREAGHAADREHVARPVDPRERRHRLLDLVVERAVEPEPGRRESDVGRRRQRAR